jgi:hypothetical protein
MARRCGFSHHLDLEALPMNNGKEILYGVVIGIALIMVYLFSPLSPRAPRASARPAAFTMQDFLSLHDGSTRSHVQLILYGTEPKLSTKVGSFETYTWEDGGRVIGVTFQDDKLTSKWQLGL